VLAAIATDAHARTDVHQGLPTVHCLLAHFTPGAGDSRQVLATRSSLPASRTGHGPDQGEFVRVGGRPVPEQAGDAGRPSTIDHPPATSDQRPVVEHFGCLTQHRIIFVDTFA